MARTWRRVQCTEAEIKYALELFPAPHQLRLAMYPQLSVNVPTVGSDRLLGQDKHVGNCSGGKPLNHEQENFFFSFRQCVHKYRSCQKDSRRTRGESESVTIL